MSYRHRRALESRHAELEQRIEREGQRPMPDEQALHALKKKKLAIRDEIASIGEHQ